MVSLLVNEEETTMMMATISALRITLSTDCVSRSVGLKMVNGHSTTLLEGMIVQEMRLNRLLTITKRSDLTTDRGLMITNHSLCRSS